MSKPTLPSDHRAFALALVVGLCLALGACGGGGSDAGRADPLASSSGDDAGLKSTAPAGPTNTLQVGIKIPGYPHKIDVYRPAGATKAIVFLHGHGARVSQFAFDLGFNGVKTAPTAPTVNWDWLARNGIIAVLPQGQFQTGTRLPTWSNYVYNSGQDDVAFLTALASHVRATYGAADVSLAGHAEGGTMTARMWCESTTLYKAFVSLAGPMPSQAYPAPGPTCTPLAPAPYYSVIGGKDAMLKNFGTGTAPTQQQKSVGLTNMVLASEWIRHLERSQANCRETPALEGSVVAASGPTWNACGWRNGYTVLTNAEHPIASLEQYAGIKMVDAIAGFIAGGMGDSSGSTTSTPGGPTQTQRVAAAKATAATNPKCSEATLGPYYWEVGDANGASVTGSSSTRAPTPTTAMWVYSASKWLYAANVIQKRGVVDSDVPFLSFRSGYSKFGNAPICVGTDTVQGCLVGRDSQDPATLGKFFYDSGHMQHHAATVMGLGPADNLALASDLNATIGNFGFTYTVPQLAAGVVVSPQGYAGFLRRMLRGELALAAALGTHKVCANPATPGCNAKSSPSSGTSEALNYSLGHWVEDDPKVGDHAFSSAGGGGFYPWIDSTKTYYGILARERSSEADAGYHSAQCGRLIRQAWKTGETVTSTMPTP